MESKVEELRSGRRPSMPPARFDDWAMGLAAAILVWICVYFLYYLLSDAWTGASDHAAKLKLTVALFLSYRVVLYTIDVLRRSGAWLTRHPLTAFVDMLALGALVIESWEESTVGSPLAPLFLVFLALVPILYRKIVDRQRYVLFSVFLVLEAVLLIVPQSTFLVGRYFDGLHNALENDRARLEALGDKPEPPPPSVDLLEVLGRVPESAALPTLYDFVVEVEKDVADVQDAAEVSRYAIEHAIRDSERLTAQGMELSRAELADARKLLERYEGRPDALLRRLESIPLVADLAERISERVATIAGLRRWWSWRIEQTRLSLEVEYGALLCDPRHVLARNYNIWLHIVLGFLVQFQVRRFVTRRIETERERTLTEMLSERHRMDAQNWINLAAGLTHNIGNEVRGYDIYLQEILEWIEDEGVSPPAEIMERLQFIYRTNHARLGFIQFLREFAMLRQVFDQERPAPRGLKSIPLEKAIRAAHARVQTIETSYNPADSTDPGDLRKRRKFLGTPLEIEFLDCDHGLRVTRGREAVLDFFFYELIKNALRNCSGERPLHVLVQRVGASGTIELSFINDLAIEARPPGTCSSCGADSGSEALLVMPVRAKQTCCADCLRQHTEQVLRDAFHPGHGSGTGLGLFVIRHFLEEYYCGIIHCGIESWDAARSRFMVYFRLVIPDDLAIAIGGAGASKDGAK